MKVVNHQRPEYSTFQPHFDLILVNVGLAHQNPLAVPLGFSVGQIWDWPLGDPKGILMGQTHIN